MNVRWLMVLAITSLLVCAPSAVRAIDSTRVDTDSMYAYSRSHAQAYTPDEPIVYDDPPPVYNSNPVDAGAGTVAHASIASAWAHMVGTGSAMSHGTPPGGSTATPHVQSVVIFGADADANYPDDALCESITYGTAQTLWEPNQAATTLNGMLRLKVEGAGQGFLEGTLYVECNNSYLTAQWSEEENIVNVFGIVGGFEIAEVHTGGLNKEYPFTETPRAQIPLTANAYGHVYLGNLAPENLDITMSAWAWYGLSN